MPLSPPKRPSNANSEEPVKKKKLDVELVSKNNLTLLGRSSKLVCRISRSGQVASRWLVYATDILSKPVVLTLWSNHASTSNLNLLQRIDDTTPTTRISASFKNLKPWGLRNEHANIISATTIEYGTTTSSAVTERVGKLSTMLEATFCNRCHGSFDASTVKHCGSQNLKGWILCLEGDDDCGLMYVEGHSIDKCVQEYQIGSTIRVRIVRRSVFFINEIVVLEPGADPESVPFSDFEPCTLFEAPVLPSVSPPQSDQSSSSSKTSFNPFR